MVEKILNKNYVLQIPRVKLLVSLLNEIYSISNYEGSQGEIIVDFKFIALWKKEPLLKWEIQCNDYLLYMNDEGFKKNIEILREEFKDIKFFCVFGYILNSFKLEQERRNGKLIIR